MNFSLFNNVVKKIEYYIEEKKELQSRLHTIYEN